MSDSISNDVSVPAEAATVNDRRMALRNAFLGALAATGYLTLSPRRAMAQQRTTLASLQLQVDDLIQETTSQGASSGALATRTSDLEGELEDVLAALDAIADGDVAVGAVDGSVRVRDSSLPGAGNGGLLRFNSTINAMQVSDGTFWRTMATTHPCVFTRYGNSTAPPQCTVLDTGVFGAGHHNHNGGSSQPILLTAETATNATTFADGGLLYPLITRESIGGINSGRVLTGALCLAPRPVVTFWGRTSPPIGWHTLYSGFAMTTHYSVHGLTTPILVDSDFTGPTFNNVGDSTSLFGLRASGPVLPGVQGQWYYVRGVVAMREI